MGCWRYAMRSVTTVGRRRGNRARRIFGGVVSVGGRCSREAKWLRSRRMQQRPRPHFRSANHLTRSDRESQVLIILGGRRTPRPKLRWPKQVAAQERDGHPLVIKHLTFCAIILVLVGSRARAIAE